ncbi:MAG: YqgE/AlgH family protein, partial [Myxococcales bacterium]
MSDLAPGFLIAVPRLADPNFERAVVLMLEHSESGAMGIVINRTSNITLGDVASSHDVAANEAVSESPVFVGGPVEPERGFVLHCRKDL